MATQI